MKILLSILTVVLLFCSCHKEVKIKLPNPEKKLIINSLFSPDSVFKVHISALQGMFDNTIPDINNAKVKLFISTGYSKYLRSAGNGIYIADSIIPALGNEYKLSITAPGYPTATATEVMPDKKIPIEKITIKDSVGIDEDGNYYSEANITFSDPVSEKNYYEIRIAFIDTLTYNGTLQYNLSNLFGNDPVIENENDIQYGPGALLFSDDLINGKKYNLKFNYYATIDYHDGRPADTNYKIAIQFNSISKEYYQYKKKLLMHLATQYSDIWGSAEPAPMYSNIEGGYGIFAGYCGVTDTIKK